jgi:hypothetical protein
MKPPQMSNPFMIEAHVTKSDREPRDNPKQQQYGISEPTAANEYGGGAFSMF